MALIRWQPFREMDELQQEFNHIFDRLGYKYSDQKNDNLTAFVPPAEMEETEEAFHLRLEVPGMNPDDLDIQVSAENISIRGERKSESKTEENGMKRSEFRYGTFQRVIPLSSRIDHNNVQADYKNGVLELTLPKAEEEKQKAVKVKVNH
ncbi:Hsp20/alpha crystallin family protein [Euhalothece natronophila Z-M001]|uniref:Hsp20/alpha crystallin family protein n=1 Tax=Euhalothece natronophila Z-M001 TaxID=522448 RepID=A0A5B8NM00_9CHRO|nr:Hsp20/alpha crystallin family protein [Euhalothece natronophila]QDZ39561.1 Hsp20/alpha crystallin family protein [Euhalothece natronophila Z-M001]